ncbi:MFS transporter [Streptomyces sp. HC307]|uniref:MFS transporter n=1 Tax=Streptomyces flavusporus TaxID=3385496 RepID=UPI003916E8FB
MLESARNNRDTSGPGSSPPGRAWLMLALATVGFAVNFWAWALLSPLGPRFKDSLDLTSFEQSLLVAVPVVAALMLRDAPGRTVPAEPLARRLTATLRLGITWQASALYAVAFGGYVAFSVYLPTYLRTGYGLAQADAANRMAGFVLLTVAMRPVGGWLSDRMGPVRVLGWSLAVVMAGAVVQSFTPSLVPLGTLACLAMAGALGAGSGAVFALVALLAPASKVGSVTGIVGAAGGLGGFVPPLVMGSLYGAYGSYAIGLALLALVAAAALAFTGTGVRHAVSRRVPAQQH